MPSFETLQGASITSMLADLAALRIEVFRAWPYLYAGDHAYEANYLAVYAKTPSAVVVVMRDGARVVGASTGLPLLGFGDDVVTPVAQAGYNVQSLYYFGESVLLPAYRGHGAGTTFFRERERAARAAGCSGATFCAVERPASHPARPNDYKPLDRLWQRVGFAPSSVIGHMSWPDVGESISSSKPMRFWFKWWA